MLITNNLHMEVNSYVMSSHLGLKPWFPYFYKMPFENNLKIHIILMFRLCFSLMRNKLAII
jgi:hypothetical protein